MDPGWAIWARVVAKSGLPAAGAALPATAALRQAVPGTCLSDRHPALLSCPCFVVKLIRRDIETGGANPIAPHPSDGLVIPGADSAWSHCCPGGGTAPATAVQALSSSEDDQAVSGSEDAQASGSTRDVVQYARDREDSADGSSEQRLADAGGRAPGGEVDKSAWDVWRSVVQAAKQHMSPSLPAPASLPEAAKQQMSPSLPAPAGRPEAAKQQMARSLPAPASLPEAAKQQMSPSLPAPPGLPVSCPARVEPEHPVVCCSSCAAPDSSSMEQHPACMHAGGTCCQRPV